MKRLILSACLAFACTGLQAEPDAKGIVNQAEELPQGLAIVPWKKTAAEDLEDGPVRLVEEPLRAIDPEVFRRRLEIHSSSNMGQ